jgi:hypothetical protein
VIDLHELLDAAESIDELRGWLEEENLKTSKSSRTVLFPAPVMPIMLEEYEKYRTKKKGHY